MLCKKRRGSILILFVAIIPLFVVVIGLMWDLGFIALIKWDLQHSATLAAAAGCRKGFDKDHFRQTGEKRIDNSSAIAAINESIQDNRLGHLTYTIVDQKAPLPDDPGGVLVVLKADVPIQFLRILPGIPSHVSIQQEARHTLKRKQM